MRLPLYIFEPRYQQMVRDCLEADRTFGVCLIRSGVEVGGPADPCEVGTTCEILATEPLGDGKMNLITLGKERFRIEELFRDAAYLEANVTLEPETEPESDLEGLPDEVHAALMEYVNLLLASHGRAPVEIRLPEEPLALSRAAGAILQVASEERQELLEAEVAPRLRRELEILKRENARLEEADDLPLVARPFELDLKRISPN